MEIEKTMKTKGKADDIDMMIGQRIKQIRTLKGKSQEWLADLVGVTFQQIQKYEKGINRVSASKVVQIADALGVSPLQFFPDQYQTENTRFADELEHECINLRVRLKNIEKLAQVKT